MENDSTFSYTYSASQNQEVQAIRRKYLPKEESKLEELKRLDHNVRMSGITESLTIGIVGCLIFGLGMCLAMGVIGQMVWLGVIVGMIGAAIMLAAYPVYRRISEKVKAKLAPRILQLADHLSSKAKQN